MKRIEMQYPYDPSFNPLYDGEVHPIIPNCFVSINIHGIDFYIMVYFDTYGSPAPMITLITQVGERFVKVPLNDLAYDYLHAYFNEHRREARVNPPEGLGNFIGLAMPMTLSDRDILEASPNLTANLVNQDVVDLLNSLENNSVQAAATQNLEPPHNPGDDKHQYAYAPKPKQHEWDLAFYIPLDENGDMRDLENVYRGSGLSYNYSDNNEKHHFNKEPICNDFLHGLLTGSKLYHYGNDGELINDYVFDAEGVKEYKFTINIPGGTTVRKKVNLPNGKTIELEKVLIPGKYNITGFYSDFTKKDYDKSSSCQYIDIDTQAGIYHDLHGQPKVFRDGGRKILNMEFDRGIGQKRY